MKICKKIGNEKPEFAYLKEIYDHLDLVANVPVRNVSATLKYYKTFEKYLT